MKNYLIKSLYEIKDPNWEVKDRSHEIDLYQKYVKCHDLSLDTYKRRLKGTWEYAYISGTFDTIHQALHETFNQIYKVWKEHYPCNILYTDPDTLAVRDFDVWGKYEHFMMFNYSDPKSFFKPNPYNEKFAHFFNAGVRYFPATMKQEIWDLGLDMVAKWNFNDYNTEQIILNRMMWSQGIKLHDALNPRMAYQAHWLPDCEIWRQDLWNGVSVNESSIIHFHSSRNIDKKLNFMQQIYNGTK